MRIHSIPPKELLDRYIHVREKKAAMQPGQNADKVELTHDAKTFSETIKAVKETMEIRAPEDLAHINEVAQQVKDNTYSVPGVSVARKILGK